MVSEDELVVMHLPDYDSIDEMKERDMSKLGDEIKRLTSK